MYLSSEKMKELFRKVSDGSATEKEKEELAILMQENISPADLDTLFPYGEWDVLTEAEMPANIEKRVLDRILMKDRMPQSGVPKGNTKPLFYRSLPAAAAVLLILLSTVLFFITNKNVEEVWITAVATNGEHKVVKLPDSSCVLLNAGSELRYSGSFNNDQRVVELRGEAYFDITPDKDLPFIVNAGKLQTTVLGTSFNVQAYDTDNEVAVTVLTGKVKIETVDDLNGGKQGAVLTAGKQVRYRSGSGEFAIQEADTLAAAGWKDHFLVFNEVNLSDILTVLGREYDVHFEVDNPKILLCKYAVTFDHISLNEVLAKLELLGELEFSVKGKNIMVTGNPCK